MAKAGQERTRNADLAPVPELQNAVETDFDATLRDSISQGMTKVLGAGGTEAILYHVKLSTVEDPKEFHEKLTGIFGVGTAALERVILQQLHQTLGVRPSAPEDDDFVNQVELARKQFATAKLQRRQ